MNAKHLLFFSLIAAIASASNVPPVVTNCNVDIEGFIKYESYRCSSLNECATKLECKEIEWKNLPDSIAGLKSLEEVELKGNFEILSSQLGKLENLKSLSLSGYFDELPFDMLGLPSLTNITLNSAYLTQLPASNEVKAALLEFHLVCDRLEVIPDEYIQRSLLKFSYKGRTMKAFPPGLTTLENLKSFVVRAQAPLPQELTNLVQLEQLEVTGTNLPKLSGLPLKSLTLNIETQDFPAELVQFGSTLNTLKIYNSNFELPKDLFVSLPNVQTFNAVNCKGGIPDIAPNMERIYISNMPDANTFPGILSDSGNKLKYLTLSNTQITSLPDLSVLTELWGFYPARNPIKQVHPNAFNLASVQSITFASNAITSWVFDKAMGARVISASDNEISSLPSMVTEVPQIVYCDKNKLTSIPDTWLQKYSYYYFGSNFLTKIPHAVLASSRAYLENNQIQRIEEADIDTTECWVMHGISIDDNGLEYIDKKFFEKCHNLKEMSLNNNKLSDESFPQETIARGIWKVELNNNSLSTIPGVFRNSKELLLNHNSISTLQSIVTWPNLLVISLNGNQIAGSLSAQPVFPETLEVLQISDNQISGIDANFFQNLQSIRGLDLSNNLIEELDASIFDGLTLSAFSVKNNPLNSLPLFNVENILELDISNTNLKSLPLNLGDASNLQRFSCAGVETNDLSSLAGLKRIQQLDLSGVKASIPDISHLRNLQRISLAGMELTEMPKLPYRLLKELDLGNNKFVTFPDEIIREVYDLEKLNLTHNEISSLNEMDVSYFGSLGSLDLSYNKLSGDDFPSGIGWMEYLNIRGNNLDCIPYALMESHLNTLDIRETKLAKFPSKLVRALESSLTKFYVDADLQIPCAHKEFFQSLEDSNIDPNDCVEIPEVTDAPICEPKIPATQNPTQKPTKPPVEEDATSGFTGSITRWNLLIVILGLLYWR